MMIHKIEPHKYYPEFRNQEPKPSDYLLLFDGEKVYLPSHTENSDVTDTSACCGFFRECRYCEASSGISSYLRGNSQAIGNPSAPGALFPRL